MNEQALLAAIGSMMEEKLEAGLKPIKEDIAGIRGRLDKIEDRLDKVEERTSRIEGRLDKIDDRLDKVEDQTGRIEGRLDKIEDRLDKVEGQTGRIEGRLDKIDDRLDKVEERTSRIEMQATRLGVIVENEVDRAVKLLGEGHEGILETIKRDFASTEELEKDRIRLFSLEETARKHTRQIENLQKRTG